MRQYLSVKLKNSQPMDSSPEGRFKTTEENWQLLKNGLQDITSKNVRTKPIRGTSNAPWFTQVHKKLCRKKERYYIKAKKKGGDHWDKYREVKRQVERTLRGRAVYATV